MSIKTFKAGLDIMNMGIWLHENGYFKDRTGLFIYWLFLTILTICVQSFFTYLVYVETDFNGFVMMQMGFISDKQIVKSSVCSNTVEGNVSIVTASLIILLALDEKIVLFVNKERHCIWKLIL
jgi:hypothetical protein